MPKSAFCQGEGYGWRILAGTQHQESVVAGFCKLSRGGLGEQAEQFRLAWLAVASRPHCGPWVFVLEFRSQNPAVIGDLGRVPHREEVDALVFGIRERYQSVVHEGRDPELAQCDGPPHGQGVVEHFTETRGHDPDVGIAAEVDLSVDGPITRNGEPSRGRPHVVRPRLRQRDSIQLGGLELEKQRCIPRSHVAGPRVRPQNSTHGAQPHGGAGKPWPSETGLCGTRAPDTRHRDEAAHAAGSRGRCREIPRSASRETLPAETSSGKEIPGIPNPGGSAEVRVVSQLFST